MIKRGDEEKSQKEGNGDIHMIGMRSRSVKCTSVVFIKVRKKNRAGLRTSPEGSRRTQRRTPDVRWEDVRTSGVGYKNRGYGNSSRDWIAYGFCRYTADASDR